MIWPKKSLVEELPKLLQNSFEAEGLANLQRPQQVALFRKERKKEKSKNKISRIAKRRFLFLSKSML